MRRHLYFQVCFYYNHLLLGSFKCLFFFLLFRIPDDTYVYIFPPDGKVSYMVLYQCITILDMFLLFYLFLGCYIPSIYLSIHIYIISYDMYNIYIYRHHIYIYHYISLYILYIYHYIIYIYIIIYPIYIYHYISYIIIVYIYIS